MTPEQEALAIAAGIAHRIDPEGWARCRGVHSTRARCARARWHDEPHDDGEDEEAWIWHDPIDRHSDPLPPTLAAAQAEWADAGGDPERGPALSGRSADGRTWKVDHYGNVQIIVGLDRGDRFPMSNGAFRWVFHGVSVAGMRECVRLAEAADGRTR